MRRDLAIALVLSVLASAAAMLWPQAPGQGIVQAVDPAVPPSAVATPGALPAPPLVAMPFAGALPREWPTVDAPPPANDPFTGLPPGQDAAPAAPAAPPVQVAAASAVVEAPMPRAPALGYRFMGRMTGPEGKRWVYIAQGDSVVPVTQGTELPNGFVVESVSESTIVFVHPPTGEHVSLPLPPKLPEEISR